MRRWAKVALAMVALGVAGAAILTLSMLRRGFSALDEPSAIEALMARTMRRYSVPADLRDKKNPVPLTPEVLAPYFGVWFTEDEIKGIASSAGEAQVFQAMRSRIGDEWWGRAMRAGGRWRAQEGYR